MVRADQAVLFDLHDTLVHLVPSTEEAMATAIGVAVDDYRSAWRTIDERIEKGEWAPASADRWTELYAPIVEHLSLSLSPAEVAARFGNLFRSLDAYSAFPDAAPALRALAHAGLRLAVLSNSDFPLEPILDRCGIGEFIEVAVAAVSHGTTKPHPKAFLLCTEALRVRPEDCWYVGDRLVDDATASAGLGMKAVLVDRVGRHSGEELAFPRIADLSLLPKIIVASRQVSLPGRQPRSG
jgi:HAD superfamily hydrolase (TIGR01549 family)